jgi:hypothetical protein
VENVSARRQSCGEGRDLPGCRRGGVVLRGGLAAGERPEHARRWSGRGRKVWCGLVRVSSDGGGFVRGAVSCRDPRTAFRGTRTTEPWSIRTVPVRMVSFGDETASPRGGAETVRPLLALTDQMFHVEQTLRAARAAALKMPARAAGRGRGVAAPV